MNPNLVWTHLLHAMTGVESSHQVVKDSEADQGRALQLFYGRLYALEGWIQIAQATCTENQFAAHTASNEVVDLQILLEAAEEVLALHGANPPFRYSTFEEKKGGVCEEGTQNAPA